MAHILIIDDDQAICRTLELHFHQRGMTVSMAHTAEDGLAAARGATFDAVISDIRLPEQDGLSLLADLRLNQPELPVIMITAFHDLETTVAAMQGGAVDYVPKPIDIDELDIALERALARNNGAAGSGLVVGPAGSDRAQIIGKSPAMNEVFKNIAMVAQSRVTVLILGESGTGKELVARAVHDASPERHQPFVAINCATLIETLLESELFGHERGAFTGAVSAHKGKIELVGEGTLFLDEVAELTPRLQGKLLRILEEREYSPVGGSQVKKSKARFIAATNVDLKERVASGAFREDLYYRLNVANITLPALRQRRGDIPLLVDYLVKKINRDLRRNIRRVSAEAMTCLCAHDWPGNVRQLENVLMKSAVMEQGDALTLAALPAEMACPAASASADVSAAASVSASSDDQPLVTLKELERAHIERVLASTCGHKGKACEILGVSRPRLERRIREFGLTVPKSDHDPFTDDE